MNQMRRFFWKAKDGTIEEAELDAIVLTYYTTPRFAQFASLALCHS